MKKQISYLLRKNPAIFTSFYGLSFLLGCITPAITFCETRLIDTITENFRHSLTWVSICPLLVMLFLLYAANYLVPSFVAYLQEMGSLKLNEEVKRSLFEKIGRIEFKHLETPDFRDKWNRISARIEERVPELMNCTSGFVSALVGIFGIFLYVFRISPFIMVVYSGEIILLFFISKRAAAAMLRLNKQFSSSERRVLYLNGITNNREYAAERKLFRYTPFINKKRITFMKEQREGQRKFDFKFALYSSGIDVAGYSATLLLMLIMFPRLRTQEITIGFFLAFSRVTLTVNNMMQNQVKGILDTATRQRLYWKEYQELLRVEEEDGLEDAGGRETIAQIQTVEFRDVCFSYPNGTEVLKDASFVLERGKHYSLVGENGAGKSTIIKLLLGLYQVTGGSILINGTDMGHYSRRMLQSLFAVVFQDFVKYSISFSENITLNQALEQERYDRMLDYTGLKKVEFKLERKSDTVLGKIEKDGKDLSGGEWQKVAIARALYRDSDFVVFDEPTASLDPISESRLYHQYYQMMKGRTTVFISHRLASATLADQILVLDRKCICESGTHEELMEQKGVYYKMFMAQRKWYWGDTEYGEGEK